MNDEREQFLLAEIERLRMQVEAAHRDRDEAVRDCHAAVADRMRAIGTPPHVETRQP